MGKDDTAGKAAPSSQSTQYYGLAGQKAPAFNWADSGGTEEASPFAILKLCEAQRMMVPKEVRDYFANLEAKAKKEKLSTDIKKVKFSV